MQFIRGGDDLMWLTFLQHGDAYIIPEYMGTFRENASSSWTPMDYRIKIIHHMHYLERSRRQWQKYEKGILICLNQEMAKLKKAQFDMKSFNKILSSIFYLKNEDKELVGFFSKIEIELKKKHRLGLLFSETKIISGSIKRFLKLLF